MQLKWQSLFLLFVLLLFATPVKSEYDCVFEHISTESGLSHGSIAAMLKDSRGFMWFATWDGLNRYDGYNFKTFKQKNIDGGYFASNRIASLEEDALGNIWIITYDQKAFRLNYFTEEFDPIPDFKEEAFHAKINGIYPLSTGDVWVSSTNQGAFRVRTDSISNQISIIHFNESTGVSLTGNSVSFLFEDANKNVWINTNKGIVCLSLDTSRDEFERKTFSDENRNIFGSQKLTSSFTKDKIVYFGTESGILLAYDIEKENIVKIEFKNTASVQNIIAAGNDALYLGTQGNGIFEIDENNKGIRRHFNQPDIRIVLKTYADSKGQLWIESPVIGISKIDLASGEFKHFEQILDINPDIRPNAAQCGLSEDDDGMWLTLKGGGFGYYDYNSDELNYFYNKPGDPSSRISNHVKCFYKDPAGVLWISTYFKGIEKVTLIKNKFQFFQPAPQLNHSIANEIRAMLVDSKDFLWVATKKQEVFILDRNYKLVKKIAVLNGETMGNVYSILEDSSGNIYLGTKGNGLFVLKRKSDHEFNSIHYKHDPDNPSSISDNNIYTLLEDKQGRIWVGTYGGGLNLLKNKQFLHYKYGMENYPFIQGNRIRYITEDMRGNLWIGTTNGIIFMKPDGNDVSQYNFKLFNAENGNIEALQSNDIFWIFCDKQANIWFSSLGGGLARLNNYPNQDQGLNFTIFTKEDGLPSDVIFTIISDESNKLWMSTENGIASFDPAKHIFKNYGQFDGITNSVFSEASVCSFEDGRIGFGSNNGFYNFQPSDFNIAQKPVHLVFTGFELFGKQISPAPESVLEKSITETVSISLKYNQNVFGISWAGLEYQMQDKIQYEYKLEGFDNTWRFAGSAIKANYTKIPPGEYRFWLRYVNPELQELNKPISIAINILPPFWKTNLAYLIYAVLSIIIMVIAWRIIMTILRLKNKVVIEKELSDIKLNFFTKISHELRTPLTLIVGPAKELQTKESLSEKGQAYAGTIEKNAQRLLRIVNQLLDFRKIQSNKMELELRKINIVDLIRTVSNNFNQLAQEKNIQFHFKSSSNEILVWIDEVKMESVISNLLSNAFKFTPENGYIAITVKKSLGEGKIKIKVKDSGCGISKTHEESLFQVFASHHHPHQKKSSGTGIGLALSRELIQLHKGKLSYKPNPKGGSIFTIGMNTGLKPSDSEIPENNVLVSHPEENIVETIPGSVNSKPKQLPQILIVEDNQELRSYLKSELSDDFIIELAKDGNEGLKKALQLQPDIILSDVMMPVMDGIELLDKIKHNFETSHIPVVLLTAKSSVESRIEGLRYGADAYLTKPFNSNELKAQLKNLLNQRVLLRENFAMLSYKSGSEAGIIITEPDGEFVNKVRLIIKENLVNTNFKIEDLYSEIGMGRSKFFNKIKGLTGLSPIDFIKEYRLSEAIALLKTGKYNVSEVSYLSGYTDAGYFSKCFKERFGKNPSELVKK